MCTLLYVLRIDIPVCWYGLVGLCYIDVILVSKAGSVLVVILGLSGEVCTREIIMGRMCFSFAGRG